MLLTVSEFESHYNESLKLEYVLLIYFFQVYWLLFLQFLQVFPSLTIQKKHFLKRYALQLMTFWFSMDVLAKDVCHELYGRSEYHFCRNVLLRKPWIFSLNLLR